MTRADKLRSMADEQLVELIFDLGADDQIDFCLNRPECLDGDVSDEECKRCLLGWLGSPVEGEENANDTSGVKEPHESPCNATGWQQRMMDVFLGGKTK